MKEKAERAGRRFEVVAISKQCVILESIDPYKSILSIPLSFVDANKIRLGQEFIISVKLIEVLTE